MLPRLAKGVRLATHSSAALHRITPQALQHIQIPQEPQFRWRGSLAVQESPATLARNLLVDTMNLVSHLQGWKAIDVPAIT